MHYFDAYCSITSSIYVLILIVLMCVGAVKSISAFDGFSDFRLEVWINILGGEGGSVCKAQEVEGKYFTKARKATSDTIVLVK